MLKYNEKIMAFPKKRILLMFATLWPLKRKPKVLAIQRALNQVPQAIISRNIEHQS